MAYLIWFNYNAEISMFNNGGYEVNFALIIILPSELQRNACQVVFWWLSGAIHNIVVSNKM